MTEFAKKIILTLLIIIVNHNVFAENDTIRLRFDISKENTNFLPADPGKPNITYLSKFVAINRNANIHINALPHNEIMAENTYIEPAGMMLTDYDNNDYQSFNHDSCYFKDEFYPKEIVTYERMPYKDFDLLLIAVATSQYNPVKKITKYLKELEINIIVDDTTKKKIEPSYMNEMIKGIVENPEYFGYQGEEFFRRGDGCNYLIVTPDDSEIKSWADTLRNFRETQGIITNVVSLREIGSNRPDSLKAFFKNARDNWNPSPDAILLLGDYSATGLTDGITTYTLTDHPEGTAFEPYFSDNQLVDFNNDYIPDIVIARMPAANGDEARHLVEKTISYERNPSQNPSYYENPVTAMGYQKNRWFQLCTEILAGYWEQHGKRCIHINSIHEGTPDSVWSTGQNTSRVLRQFGPEGLGYIPATMSHLTDWNGSDDDISEAIENGAFMITHRDHGTYETWGEPHFSTSDINVLDNEELTFVLSANCQTGHFGIGCDYYDCFAERFLRIENGAVAVIAASELSYSYVNDTYVWGLFDYLYPDFMPEYGSQDIDFQYPAFANTYGKIFLKKSSFPYNTDRVAITNKIFHYFGDAFLQLNSEMPEKIEISHPNSILTDETSLKIEAEAGTHIALSIGNQLISKGKSMNGEVTLNFCPLQVGAKIKVVATKQNHFRHESFISVTNDIGVDEIDELPFDLYPNPCKDEIEIKGNNIVNIIIFNTLGQIVRVIEANNSNIEKVETADLPNGIYFIQVNGVFIQKLSKTK